MTWVWWPHTISCRVSFGDLCGVSKGHVLHKTARTQSLCEVTRLHAYLNAQRLGRRLKGNMYMYQSSWRMILSPSFPRYAVRNDRFLTQHLSPVLANLSNSNTLIASTSLFSHHCEQYPSWQVIYSYFQFCRLIFLNRRETNLPIGCDSSFVSVMPKWDISWIKMGF